MYVACAVDMKITVSRSCTLQSQGTSSVLLKTQLGSDQNRSELRVSIFRKHEFEDSDNRIRSCIPSLE
jgi:hypothetical protein